MRIAVGSDEATHLTTALVEDLVTRGYEIIVCGALRAGASADWPDASSTVARLVASGEADSGIVCCWTGTGASIAANKVRGARTALCGDAETARGARRWNDANVLALSLRATSEAIAREILDAWLATAPDADTWNQAQLRKLDALDDSAQPEEDSHGAHG
jgi:ribose 5-phosphate isomerase B